MRYTHLKRGIVIALSFILTLPTFSQSNTDSLEQVWNNNSLDIAERMSAGSELCKALLYSNTGKSMEIAQDMIKLSSDLEGTKWPAQGHLNLGSSYWALSEFANALNEFNLALKLSQEIQNKALIAQAYNNIGIIYDILGDYAKALSNYEESLKLKLELDDQAGLAIAYSNIGNIYETQGEHEKALDYHNKSLAIDMAANNRSGIAQTNINLGLIHARIGNTARAKELYEQSIALYTELNDKGGIANGLNNLGKLLDRQGNFDEAIRNYEKCLKLQNEINDLTGAANSQTNIGFAYIGKRQYDKAIAACEKSYLSAEKSGFKIQQRDACECLYIGHKRKRNEGRALDYLERLLTLNDQLANDETANILQQLEHTQDLKIMELSYKSQQSQDSIAAEKEKLAMELAHHEEIQRKENIQKIFLGAGIMILIVAGGLFNQLRIVRRSRKIIRYEKDRSEKLLLNILPEEIATELKEKGHADAKSHDKVTILFTDFKEFTQTSEKLSATELVMEINTCFEAFDRIMEKNSVEKIKTIGDAYMAAGGLPVPEKDSVINTVKAALEMQYFITERKKKLDALGKTAFEMRVGIHTGSAVAGIVGVKKFQYDIWGDTVNTASRMESTGEVGKVNISSSTYEIVKDNNIFKFEYRGKVEAKHKGAIDMYFVEFANGYGPTMELDEEISQDLTV